MTKYTYNGPVTSFDTLIANNWKGATMAKTEKKARSNLAYQFKKSNNLLPSAKIELPGKVVAS